jgi:hypothetical protein
MSASLLGRSGSSAFRPIRHCGVDVARGLALLFGLGTRALPLWDSKTRWNNLLGGCHQATVGPSRHTNSPHPSSREGHHSTTRRSSSVLLLGSILHRSFQFLGANYWKLFYGKWKMSATGRKADIAERLTHVRFSSKSGHRTMTGECERKPLCNRLSFIYQEPIASCG